MPCSSASGARLKMFGPGDGVVVAAASSYTQPLDVLLLGGLPIRAPIVHHGPFVMNTRAEILQAIEDYRSGRLGIIPADQLAPGARLRAFRLPDSDVEPSCKGSAPFCD